MKKYFKGLLLILLMLGITACAKSAGNRILEQLNLGQKYLAEAKYEEAVAAFTKVISIDPKQMDAFFGRAQAYEGMAEVMAEGGEKTETAKLMSDGETEEGVLALAVADYEMALKLAEERISAGKDTSDNTTLKAVVNRLAVLYEKTGKTEKLEKLQNKYGDLIESGGSDHNGKQDKDDVETDALNGTEKAIEKAWNNQNEKALWIKLGAMFGRQNLPEWSNWYANKEPLFDRLKQERELPVGLIPSDVVADWLLSFNWHFWTSDVLGDAVTVEFDNDTDSLRKTTVNEIFKENLGLDISKAVFMEYDPLEDWFDDGVRIDEEWYHLSFPEGDEGNTTQNFELNKYKIEDGQLYVHGIVYTSGSAEIYANNSGVEVLRGSAGRSVRWGMTPNTLVLSYHPENGYSSFYLEDCYIDEAADAEDGWIIDTEAENAAKSVDESVIFLDSSVRRLTAEDTAGMSKEQLRYARNEIYARHGRIFKDEALKAYFDEKSWYEGYIEPEYFKDEWYLNEVERANVAFLQQEESTR